MQSCQGANTQEPRNQESPKYSQWGKGGGIKDFFPLLIPTNKRILSKVSNSNDKFGQTGGEILKKEGCLATNSGSNQLLRPFVDYSF
jgi:hypothetical protein